MGLSEFDFWHLTFREFDALLNRMWKVKETEEYNANYRTASILAMIANAFRGSNQRTFQPSDFLPTKAEPTKKVPDPDQLLDELRLWNASIGGEEIIK